MPSTPKRIDFPELFIGLVAPIGVDLSAIIASTKLRFEALGYHVIDIKVTDQFLNLAQSIPPVGYDLNFVNFEDRVNRYIKYGNQLREHFNDSAILAEFSIFQVMEKRREYLSKNKDAVAYEKIVYLMHQFKRPEEIELLRSVYGKSFFQISVYSKRSQRIEFLSGKISRSHNSRDRDSFRAIANELVVRDENEVKLKFGQRLQKIFHDADFIVNTDYIKQSIDTQIDRFVQLLMGSNSISPNKYEYGLFSAKAAALRTLDLSRQVGAAIFRKSGEIISMGSNEVPKAGGGTYWDDDQPYDAREYTLKEDSNDIRKTELLKEIFDAVEPKIPFEDFKNQEKILNLQFMDALEYGRIIHAEMSAITDAARLGLSLNGSILFCTTFPCHMCAKHIVASGIQKVIFLEPYPKSLAHDLHMDSIEVEKGNRGKYSKFEAVPFEHFFGVTPRRYREFFERSKRKKDGIFQPYSLGEPKPLIDLKFPFYARLETFMADERRK